MPTTYDCFISYNSGDVTEAEKIYQQLTAAGLTVWFDKIRLQPGFNWHKEIEAGCEASRILLPVLTPNWQKSEWTKYETYGAEAVIPLIVDGEFEQIFTPPLTRFQGLAIDLRTEEPADWEKLISSIWELLKQTSPQKLNRLANVRHQANPFFVGREKELLEIHEALHQQPTAVLTQGQVRAIAALGGIGKTTLARHYIEKFWRCYPQIFWIDCRLGLETEFARLCDLLLPQMREVTDIPAKARAALQTLNESRDRLLIIDNAEDEVTIQQWIPKAGDCRTLITSRFAGWSAAIQSLHLYVLELEPARELLTSRPGRVAFANLPVQEQTACDELAKELGYLPLALEQAAAYMAEEGTGYTFAKYLAHYRAATKTLLGKQVLGSTEYPDAVLTTWTVTEEKLKPGSRAILRLCGFLAPTPIPLEVWINGINEVLAESTLVDDIDTANSTEVELWVRDQLKQLRDYSLVEGDGQAISVHPLVQTVQRLQLGWPNQGEETLQRILSALHNPPGDPQDFRTWPAWELLSLHYLQATEYAEQIGIAEPTGTLLNNVAQLFDAKAQYETAEPLMRRALKIDEAAYGPDHPNVARDLNNLARLLHETNRLDEAEPLMRRALKFDEAAYGPDHPNVSIHMNNLALLLKDTNRLPEAEPLMWRALKIDEAAYGPDHPLVAIRLNNLANLLQKTNRRDEAEPLMWRALEIGELQYGHDHPKVASSLNSLASLLHATNRLDKAEPLLRRALKIDEAAYGPDHPNVAISLNNLAVLLYETNRFEEAEPLMRRVIQMFEDSYGVNHPKVASSLNSLASLLQATNRLDESEPLMRRALEIDEAAYGRDHPEVARDLNNLANLLQDTNRLEEAEPLMRRALKITEAAYGPDHPEVAIRLNNLANLLLETNRLDEAEPLMRRMLLVFLSFQRNTSHQHPFFEAGLKNYQILLQDMGSTEDEIIDRIKSLLNEAAAE